MLNAIIETLTMVGVSGVISNLIALPLASLLLETRPMGLFPNKFINFLMNRFVDLFRAIPFALLIILLFPATRFIVGTSIGTVATIPALIMGAIPFEMRLFEESMSQVNQEAVEAAMLDGANNLQIITLIKWASKLDLIVSNVGISLITILGYSAMAGMIGGGGLGNYALVYGFQRFNWMIVFEATLIIVLIVFVIQITMNLIIRRLER